MKLTRVFLISSYLLILLGLIGLLYTGEVSWPYILAAAAALAAGTVIDLRKIKAFLPAVLADLAMIAILGLTFAAIFFFGAAPIQELVHFLLALQAVKLLAPKKNRDWLQLYLLSFFSVVAASALTVELSFAAIFICYLFLAPWTLMLLQLKEASESAGKDPDSGTAPPNAALVALAGKTGVALCVLTLLFFLIFPRLSVRLFADTWASGSAVTGFSDLLTLGQVAEIQRNNSVAMRVIMDRARLSTPTPYWRGIALDFFDGTRWRKSRAQSVFLPRRDDIYVAAESAETPDTLVRQQVVLEPNGSAALFALDRPVTLSGRLGSVYRDFLGNLRLVHASPFQVSYEVYSDTRQGRLDEPPRASFLQLPPLDSRITALAQTIAQSFASDEQRAYALERFLKQAYRYTLEGLPHGVDEPLSAFLFDARQGNCEYFSSSLAVMLRALEIPARVVNGYMGGEWNPYGGYFLVRQSDAHSWVEAYLGGKGWVTLDPTPSLPLASRRSVSAAGLFFDFLQLRWYRYVVNFGVDDQQQLVSALRRPNLWFDSAVRGLRLENFSLRAPTTSIAWIQWLSALLALAAALAVVKKCLSAWLFSSSRPHHEATERYQLFLNLAEKKVGLKKRPGETADEFGARAQAVGIARAGELTRLYHQARFSGTAARAELNQMEAILVAMKNYKSATQRRRP